MGVDKHVLRLILESKRKGVSFAQTMTIGRQNYHELTPNELHASLQLSGFRLTEVQAARLYHERGRFIEPLFQFLGAQTIESIDASSYEHASVVHDLNQPIPDHLKGAFSCVLDGGAIEHVFNFPQAIKNCMEMVSDGGHFLGVTTANNFTGHGFYQFSPELYYRVFSEQNGYAVEEMVMCETDGGAPWYSVADPEKLGRRVEWVNSRPTYLIVRARKLRRAEIFQAPPQQSDYVAAWSNRVVAEALPPPPVRFLRLRRLMPESMKSVLRFMLGRRRLTPIPDGEAFRKVRLG